MCSYALKISARVYGGVLSRSFSFICIICLIHLLLLILKKSRSSLCLKFSKLSKQVLSYRCLDQEQQLHSSTDSGDVSFLPRSTSVKTQEGKQESQTWPLSDHEVKCEERCLTHIYLMSYKNQKQHSICIL